MAASIGCTAVKTQHFRVKQLYSQEALVSKPHLLERQSFELPWSWHDKLLNMAIDLRLAYGTTLFSRKLTDYERAEPCVDFFKVSSYQLPDLEQVGCAYQHRPLILSTGMAEMDEVEKAVSVIAGYGCVDMTLLHCVSAYPAPANEANLRAIPVLREEYDCPVGWSDHTHSELVLMRAVHRFKADTVEFHLDLDGNGSEYDGGHCWLPEEIEGIIKGGARYDDEGYYACDGKGIKVPTIHETEEREWRSDPSDGLRPTLAMRKKLLEESSSGSSVG